ncbi:MAG TPA: hypothetical protein VGO11_12515 [Chthoniobacteraceae bacterium]|jgi:hypothetical protein|nr:hypothetical protein [Chthoniobacteraceae bacterium]
MRNLFLLAGFLFCLLIDSVAGGEEKSFTFYRDYRAPIPSDNYVVFEARAFGPDNYVVLDLKAKEARIYSPYQERGLLHTHRLTDAEYKQAMALLTSPKMQKIPARSNKLALDAFEFSANAIVNGKPFKFHHILPEDKAVLALYDLYKHFRDTAPKE